MIVELTKLVPDWITIKNFGQKGNYLKVVNPIPAYTVQQQLKTRV